MEVMVDHYMNTPSPSWKVIAEALRKVNLHKQADEVITKYVKGMDVNHVMCLIMIHLIQAVDGQLWYLITTIMIKSNELYLDCNSEYTSIVIHSRS